MNESFYTCISSHTYEWIVSRINVHVTYKWVKSRIWMSNVTCSNVTCMGDMTYATWRNHLQHTISRRPPQHPRTSSRSCVTWPIYARHNSFTQHLTTTHHSPAGTSEISMSHVVHEWVMARMHEKYMNAPHDVGCICNRDGSRHKWVMARMNETYMNATRIRMRHVICEWNVSHMNG